METRYGEWVHSNHLTSSRIRMLLDHSDSALSSLDCGQNVGKYSHAHVARDLGVSHASLYRCLSQLTR